MKLKCDDKKFRSWQYEPVDASWVQILPKTLGLTSYTSFELTVTVRLEMAVVCSVLSISPFVKDISKLLDEAAFPDFTFIVGGKEFKVHRSILGLASPVMVKLFSTDIARKQRKRCELTDVDPFIFEIMLRYIYCGNIPENFNRIAKDLFEAAHVYQIEPLMKTCLTAVSNQLNIANALELFEWSDRLDLLALKVKSWGLVKRYEIACLSYFTFIFLIIFSYILKITQKLKTEPLSLATVHEILDLRRKEKELLESLMA